MIEINELVKRLMEKQPIVANTGRQATVEGFKEAVDRGNVFIKFTETKGGTELNVRLDKQHSDFSAADYAGKAGVVKVGGELTLNYEKVRLHAEVDLATLTGTGWLEYIEPAEEWRKKQMS
jgi:hypothetical protein